LAFSGAIVGALIALWASGIVAAVEFHGILPFQEIATGFGVLLIPNQKNGFQILMMGSEMVPETSVIFMH
jgi:hypothetical protein